MMPLIYRWTNGEGAFRGVIQIFVCPLSSFPPSFLPSFPPSLLLRARCTRTLHRGRTVRCAKIPLFSTTGRLMLATGPRSPQRLLVHQ